MSCPLFDLLFLFQFMHRFFVFEMLYKTQDQHGRYEQKHKVKLIRQPIYELIMDFEKRWQRRRF